MAEDHEPQRLITDVESGERAARLIMEFTADAQSGISAGFDLVGMVVIEPEPRPEPDDPGTSRRG